MEIEINNFGDLVGYCHLYYQQHKIDEYPIDFAEFQHRLGWIKFQDNLAKYNEDYVNASEDEKLIIQRVLDLLN